MVFQLFGSLKFELLIQSVFGLNKTEVPVNSVRPIPSIEAQTRMGVCVS